MWTISETNVTTTNIIAVSPSTCWPRVMWTLPLLHHVRCWSTMCSSLIHCAATMRARTKLVPTAMIPDSDPPFGIFFPNSRMMKYDSAGRSGISQAFSAIETPLALHEVDLVKVDADPVAVDEQDDRQADADLGGRDGDDEQGEDLAGGVAQAGGEGHQVDVHGVEHQLDAHEDQDAVAPGQHAVDAGAEEEGRQEQVLRDRHGVSPSWPGRWRRRGRRAGAWRPPRSRRRRCGRSSRRWRSSGWAGRAGASRRRTRRTAGRPARRRSASTPARPARAGRCRTRRSSASGAGSA